MTESSLQDLELRALQYLHGELDAQAEADFEAVLAEDQAARELLTDLVWIAEASRAAAPATARTGPSRWRWVAAAAGLLLGSYLCYRLLVGAPEAVADVFDDQILDRHAPAVEAMWEEFALGAVVEEAEDVEDLKSPPRVDDPPRIPAWMLEGL